MSNYEQKEGQGSLFKNDKKNATHIIKTKEKNKKLYRLKNCIRFFSPPP